MEPVPRVPTDGPCQVVGVKKYILICLALWGNYLSLHVIINFHMSFQKNLKLLEPQNEIFNLHKYRSRPPYPLLLFLRREKIKKILFHVFPPPPTGYCH